MGIPKEERKEQKFSFKIKEVIRNKEGHYIIIKRSILQEYIKILSMYAPNNRVKLHESNLVELQGEIDESTTMVGDINNPV